MTRQFEVSRRDLLRGVSGLVLPAAGTARAAAAGDAAADDYASTLVDGYTPAYPLAWADLLDWKVAAGSTWNRGMEHSVRMSPARRRIRFEVRDTEMDRPKGDEIKKRRAEIKGSRHILPNGVPLWGAMSFRHAAWAEPATMGLFYGGVYGQIHIGSTFGGSPAVAFRRHKSGRFMVTTRGESNPSNTVRYKEELAFDEVHDLVYRAVLHPSLGQLAVWLNGRRIVDVAGQSIGAGTAECYWHVGVYFSGGITCPVAAEYANHLYPAPRDLTDRIDNRPAWPDD